jgi:preprotein translocase subunit SecG
VISVLVVIVHVIVALALVLIVLLQVGQGQSIGAAFGGAGSSQTLFGSRGPATFLSRLTTISAAVFMLTSLALAYMSSHAREQSVITNQPPISQEAPATSQPEKAPAAPNQPAEPTPAPAPPQSEGKQQQ